MRHKNLEKLFTQKDLDEAMKAIDRAAYIDEYSRSKPGEVPKLISILEKYAHGKNSAQIYLDSLKKYQSFQSK